MISHKHKFKGCVCPASLRLAYSTADFLFRWCPPPMKFPDDLSARSHLGAFLISLILLAGTPKSFSNTL